MATSITIRSGDAPADLQHFAEEKCARLNKFLRDAPRVEFVLKKDHTNWDGEATLHGSRHHERLVAHDAHADAHGCIELLVEKLERQLEKSKEKRKDHRGPSMADGAPRKPEDGASADEPTYEDIVRRDLKGGK